MFKDSKLIEKDYRNENNLFHLPPSTDANYFMDAIAIVRQNPTYEKLKLDGLLDLNSKKTKTNGFGHYDTLIFSAKGEVIRNRCVYNQQKNKTVSPDDFSLLQKT